jgi:diguanylate cyclase (GGDEF)-like protein/PAS domain S-box-containing protein
MATGGFQRSVQKAANLALPWHARVEWIVRLASYVLLLVAALELLTPGPHRYWLGGALLVILFLVRFPNLLQGQWAVLPAGIAAALLEVALWYQPERLHLYTLLFCALLVNSAPLLSWTFALITTGMIYGAYVMATVNPLQAGWTALDPTQLVVDAMGFGLLAVVVKSLVDGHRAIEGLNRKLEREARHARRVAAEYKRTLDLSVDLVTSIGFDGTFRAVNQAATAMLGYQPQDLVGRAVLDLVYPADYSKVAQALDAMQRGLSVRNLQFRLLDAGGHPVWLECNGTPVDEETVTVCVMRNITGRRAVQAELEQQALTDPLTGLPNRAGLREQMAVALADIGAPRIALLFLDLDGFKPINDTYGHAAGDQLLLAVGARLRSGVKRHDVVARLGGDEFTVLLRSVGDVHDALGIAERLAAAVRQPVLFEGKELRVSTSVGIALGRPGLDDPERLMQQADAAMYAAKRSGKDRVVVFDPRVHSLG